MGGSREKVEREKMMKNHNLALANLAAAINGDPVIEFEAHKINRAGWTTWITPVHKKYMMKCCDCGLVHEFQYGVIKQTGKEDKAGYFSSVEPKEKGLRVKMRARRAK